MKSARALGGLCVLVIAIGVAFSGCKPQQTEQQVVEPIEQVEETIIVEQPAVEPAEQPVEEPAEEPTEEPAEKPEDTPAAAPSEVKVSDFAPADDLAAQVSEYIEKLEEAVKTEEEYNDSESKIDRGANTLVLIALALGLHDEDSEYKSSAAAMMQAAAELAAAEDFAAAQAAVAALKSAADGKGDAVDIELKWEKVAPIEPIVEQSQIVYTKLKRFVKGKRFESKADQTRGLSAVIAVIAHGTIPNVDETKKPDAVAEWEKLCIQMRDAAAEVNAGIRAADKDATAAAMAKLDQSCHDCHAVFHEEE